MKFNQKIMKNLVENAYKSHKKLNVSYKNYLKNIKELQKTSYENKKQLVSLSKSWKTYVKTQTSHRNSRINQIKILKNTKKLLKTCEK